MYLFKHNDTIPWEGCVATVGFFDGVHAGHRYLLHELNSIARQQRLNATVITFDKHPRKVLNADFQPKLLNTLDEKIQQLSSTHIDACIILDFNKEFSGLSANEFIKDILAHKLNVKVLLVGHDHRFGHNREEGFIEYQTYGNEVGMKVIEASQFTQGEFTHISSSEIRKSLELGEINKANTLLTYHYSFSGKIVKGNQLGRRIGFPTANITIEERDKIIPKTGVYAVFIHLKNEVYRGMMNIGYRPTIEFSSDKKIEINIFDFEKDIYGETIKIEIIKYIRDEQRFKNLIELQKQLQKDKETIELIL